MNRNTRKTTVIHIPNIKKKNIAMLLVMAIFISILPDSFTASAAEAIKEATQDTPALTMQFATNSTWGGSIAAEIILKNESSKNITNWKITFSWKPVITSLWCAQYKTEEKSGLEGAAEPTNCYTIYPYEYNNTISPDSEIRIGLIASGEEAELIEPDLYEIEIDGENWVYNTNEGRLKKPEEAEEPEITAEPEMTEEPTEEPEFSEIPEVTATPEVTEEPTETPEITEAPEITATPEVTENPTEEPEFSEEPEITAAPEVTEDPTPEPENTPAPTATPEPTKEPDYNLEDYEFTDDLVITSDKTLTKNISCANLYIKNGTLNTDGYQLTVRENTEQSGGKLTIENESKVTVKGKATLTAGILSINDGRLQTEGNFTATGTGELQINTENSHAIIGGDCYLESRQRINSGLLEIKGNLDIPHKSWLKNGINVNIKLSGSKTQTVTTEEETYLHSLDITESAGVEFMQPIHAGTLTGIENITGKKAIFAVSTISLTKDTELDYDIEIQSGEWKLGQNKLTIAENLELTGGSLLAEEGTIKVQGNLHAAGGELNLRSEKAHAIIGGDCQIESGQRISGGLLEIKGNLNIPHQNWLKNGINVNLKLSGKNIQSVTVEDGTNLHNLDLTESAGVEFMQPIHAGTLTGIENITGEKATFAVSTISLTKDTELEYDVEIQSGEWKLGQNKLTIAENLELTGGSLLAEEGTIIIWGDLYAAGGELNLRSEKAHVTVEGDCCIESGQRISGGLLEIKGNLNIPNKNWLKNGNNVNIKLSGSRIQKVTTEEETYLHNLDITESKGVKFATAIHADTLNGIEKLTGEEKTLYVSQAYLTEDAVLRGDLTIGEGRVNINGHRLKLQGDLSIKKGALSTAVQSSHTDIQGSCTMESGMLDIGKGSIQIQKKCQLNGMADINMCDPEGVLIIRKSLTADGHSQLGMAEGNVYLGGDLTQTEEAGWINLQIGAVLHLNGDSTQTVSLEKPSALRFAHIDMTQSAGVNYASAVHIQKIDGWDRLQGESLILCGYNDILREDLDYTGHLRLVGSILRLDSHTLGTGWLEQYDSRIEIQAGKLTVAANHGLYGMSALEMTDKRGSLEVHGNLTTYSEISHRGILTAGDIYLWGNLSAYGANYGFAVSDSLTVHFMQHYLDLSDPNSGSIQEVYMRDPEASYIPEANKDIPYGATVNFIHAQDMEVTSDTLLYYFSVGVAEEITHAEEHFPEYVGMSALFAVLAKIGPVLGAKVTAAGTKIVGEAAAGLIAENIGIMAAGLVVVLMAGPIIKDLYINYGNPNQAAKQIGQSLTNLTIYAAMTAVISGGITLATEKEARELVKNILAEIKTMLIRFKSDNRGESRYLTDLMAGITGTEAIQKEISAYLTEQAAAQTKNLPKEILNKAEAILRKYFSGRQLGETEFSFLLRHIDDLEGKDLADGIEWAIQNSKTLSNLAYDAIDYCYKKWAGYEEDGILESIKKAIAENSGKATAEDVKKFADDAVKALSAKDMSIISSIIDRIPNRYKQKFQCDKFVDKMISLMKENKLIGEKIFVQSNTQYILSDKNGIISENGKHYAIKIGEVVYDNLNPNGVDYNNWLSDLGISDLPSMFDITISLID